MLMSIFAVIAVHEQSSTIAPCLKGESSGSACRIANGAFAFSSKVRVEAPVKAVAWTIAESHLGLLIGRSTDET